MRDREIVIDRNRGLSWPLVAQRHGISERQARNICSAWREAEKDSVIGRDPVEWVFEALDRFESVIGSLALVAETGDNSAAKVGALKAQMAAMDSQFNLLQATGLLPRQLRDVGAKLDYQFLADVIVEVFDKYEVPVEAADEIIDAISTRC